MTGELKANVGGLWTPVMSATGPPGPDGVGGPPRAVGRGFSASLRFPGTIPANGNSLLLVNTPILNDGWSYDTTQLRFLGPDGRFHFYASVTLTNGVAANYWILIMRLIRNKATIGQYDVVCQNTSAGFRSGQVSAVFDMTANDAVNILITADTAGASVDGRSWFTAAEVAW